MVGVLGGWGSDDVHMKRWGPAQEVARGRTPVPPEIPALIEYNYVGYNV